MAKNTTPNLGLSILDEAFDSGAMGPSNSPSAMAPLSPAPITPSYDPTASPLYLGTQNAANNQYANTLTHLTQNENVAASNLGYTNETHDGVTGWNVDWGTIDTTNPFSRAALLKHSYLQGQTGTANSYAERGMGVSGAKDAALGGQQFNYEQGQDSIAKELAQIILNSKQGKEDAAVNKDNTTLQGLFAALQAAPTP